MVYNDPLSTRRHRRRGTTAAALVVALLSAAVYQCSDRKQAATPSSGVRHEHSSEQRTSAQHAPAVPATEANRNFDFYLLALSLAPAFCEDGHQSRRECRALDPQSFAATPLTLHGLWPESLQPGQYQRNCQAGALQLAPATRSALRRWMPGEADGLANHEWREHGACTGLSADNYFNAAMDWTARMNVVLGGAIRDVAGGSANVATLRAAAAAVRPGIGESIIFVCKNLRGAAPGLQRRPFLTEVRVCLSRAADGAPQSLLQCAQVQRRDQGCGGSFQVDAP